MPGVGFCFLSASWFALNLFAIAKEIQYENRCLSSC